VVPARRRQGVGYRIVELLLMNASSRSVRRAFLLTTDAQAYFGGLGFAPDDRKHAHKHAPSAILATRQAARLCPASAVLDGRKR
jgi:arsenate reductase